MCWRDVVTFLDNNSVGAFVGAFSAFFLIVATDWRRRRGKKALVKIRVSIDRDLAAKKLETALRNIGMIRNNQVTDAPVMRFPVDTMRAIQRECLDLLTADEIHAIDALLFWMEGIDGLFDNAKDHAQSIRRLAAVGASPAERSQAGGRMIESLEDAAVNLRAFRHLASLYISGNFRAILDFQMTREQFTHD